MRSFLRPALAGALGLSRRFAFASLATLGAAGCDQSGAPTSSEPSLSVTVAPLDLPNMTDACYGLTVYNTTTIADFSATTRVWTQPDLCASQYGAEGGIRFTGICDAQADGETHDNSIRLVLNNVYRGGTAGDGGTALASDSTTPPGNDYVNPCPPPSAENADNGCILTAPCSENQDSKIVFNLTVMRNAELGFFDTVVRFSDLFCAAKTDCVEDDGTTTLNYLPIPGSTPPADGPTAVVGFACTGGADASGTYLYLNDLVVTCVDGTSTRTATVDPSAGPGNVGHSESDTARPVLFAAAVNRGDGLQQGTAYWNVLLGMSLDGNPGETCTLTTSATASESVLTAGATPEHTRYPVIAWSVPLSTGTVRTCTRHPLNVEGSGVATIYTTISTPATFAYQMARLDEGDATSTTPPAPTSLCPCFAGWTAARLAGAPEGTYTYADANGPWGYDAYYFSTNTMSEVVFSSTDPTGAGAGVCIYSTAGWGDTQIGTSGAVTAACKADFQAIFGIQ